MKSAEVATLYLATKEKPKSVESGGGRWRNYTSQQSTPLCLLVPAGQNYI